MLFVFGSFVPRVGVSLAAPCSLISGAGPCHCIVSPRSQLVAKFEANIDSLGIAAVNVLGVEVLVHPCGQVVIELVGDAVVDLEVAAIFDAGVESGGIGGLEVVSHLNVHGHVKEALVVGVFALGISQVQGHLGEMLPAGILQGGTDRDRVVIFLRKLGVGGGPQVGD